jgi:hypothetical protein
MLGAGQAKLFEFLKPVIDDAHVAWVAEGNAAAEPLFLLHRSDRGRAAWCADRPCRIGGQKSFDPEHHCPAGRRAAAYVWKGLLIKLTSLTYMFF